MLGNEAKTDAMGYIRPYKQHSKLHDAKAHIFTRIKRNYDIQVTYDIATLNVGQIHSPSVLQLKATSNCWICEGWTEFKFTFEPHEPEKIDNDTMPVMLHLSADNFEGELLLRENSSFEVIYSTMRMLPPGEISYYFTVNGEVNLSGDA